MKFKRLSFLFVFVLVLNTFFASFAFADENPKPNLAALGDSITFGLYLEAGQVQASPNAFPSLIAGGKFNVSNFGVPGLTSSQLLAGFDADPRVKPALQSANVITLNIGNNDIMLAADLKKIIENQTPVDPIELLPKVTAAATQLGVNLQAIVGKIRQQNQTAPIILYNLYNPFGEGDDEFLASLHNIGELLIPSVNANVIAPFGNKLGIYVADAYSAFNGHQAQYVFAPPIDLIHPTLDGQRALAALADRILAALAPKDFDIELSANPTEPTQGPVTVTVSTTAEEVLAMKWLDGEKTVADFEDAGTAITDNQFQVTENGKYTVYVLNGQGIEKVSVIEINNIVEAPKDFDIELTPSTTVPTTEPVTITVSTTATEVTQMRWLAGDKVHEDFYDGAGTDINDNQFQVTENGKYTVFVRDGQGLRKVKVIEITNITAEKPEDPTTPDPGDGGDDPTPPGDNGGDNPTPPGDNGGDDGSGSSPGPTDKGGKLPVTATPIYNYMAVGIALILAGLAAMKIQQVRRRINI
ncbi:SGNH/GDSL hydrolase family protein [Neobacillus sp. NPDC093127]|uniref:SGNH/GDSL hydrolase family protein n=1 Tax=Neobacillus sp. NPDC093127 TaxID=3364296 RepID=UPI0037F61304